MSQDRDLQRASRIFVSMIAGIGLLYLLYFMPLPLYIFKPGTAEVIAPMVQVKEAAGEDRGQLMLTTVQVSDATIARYLLSYVLPYQELRKKQELLRDNESEEEYSQRQTVVMISSQASAIQAAYNKLKVPYHIASEGVVIERVYNGFPAHDVLHPGDYIVEIDGRPIQSYEDVRAALAAKQAGDTASVSYKRKGNVQTAQIGLAVLPAAEGADPAAAGQTPRVGLGVVPAEMQSVKAENESQQIAIQAGDIGGPSAGLMFSLEIYNRLVPEDITKGYRIAGTGEIDPEGRVGVIGGIMHKIVAADKAGAEIFFAPKDYQGAGGVGVPNYSDAKKRAEEIGTKMKVVPVGTLDDALQYLAGLESKSTS